MGNRANPPSHPLLRQCGKSKTKQMRSTLEVVAQLGECTPEEANRAHKGRSKFAAVRLWDLQAAGLVEGFGQHPHYAKGISHTYRITDLGLVALAWSR